MCEIRCTKMTCEMTQHGPVDLQFEINEETIHCHTYLVLEISRRVQAGSTIGRVNCLPAYIPCCAVLE